MKHVYGIVLILAVTVLMAQTASPTWSGMETQQLLSSCTPHNADSVVCVATDGVSFSYQGAAFVKVASQGAQGPTGPQGPAGAMGPQGIPGPVQSFGTLSCPKTSSGTGIVLGPGCTETNP